MTQAELLKAAAAADALIACFRNVSLTCNVPDSEDEIAAKASDIRQAIERHLDKEIKHQSRVVVYREGQRTE